MLKRCMKPTTNTYVLAWPILRRPEFVVITYKSVIGASRLKETTQEKSREKWLYMKAREVTSRIEFLPKKQFQTVLNMIARKNGYVLIKQTSMLLSVSACIAVCDHIGLGTNGLHRMKQVLETLVPLL